MVGNVSLDIRPAMCEKRQSQMTEGCPVSKAQYCTSAVSQKNDIVDVNITLKKTRRGQIRQIVREVYFRDDIPCGISDCKVCKRMGNPEVLSLDGQKILIVDREVALYQMDSLCIDPSITNCVLPASVLDNVRKHNRHFYTRLRKLCNHSIDTQASTKVENDIALSVNRNFYVYSNHISRETYTPRFCGETFEDYSDRQVEMLAAWYCEHISLTFNLKKEEAKTKVLLLTNSKRSAMKHLNPDVQAICVADYAVSVRHLYPMAGEWLGPIEEDITASDQQRKTALVGERTTRYVPHLRQDVIHEKLASGQLHQGVIRMDRNSNIHGTVDTVKFSSVRILGYRAVNRAVDGDLVVIQLVTPEGRAADTFMRDIEQEDEEPVHMNVSIVGDTAIEVPSEALMSDSVAPSAQLDTRSVYYGKVVGICRRNWKEYSGSLIPLDDSEATRAASFEKMERQFRPWDPRIPDIIIKTRQSLHLDGKRLVVAIDSWDCDNKYPSGHWVHVVGNIDDVDVEAQVILNEYDVITKEFTDAVLRCLPPADYTIPPQEIERREDFRGVMTFSIDPPGCKDIDDALSCDVLPNGNYKVAVHIADVTHFVLPDTPLDSEASKRCTTVYLVERRTDMLPGLLTTDLCSLRSNVDRLAFSVIWEITAAGSILSTDFKKTVIRSNKALTYEEAQALLDDPFDNSVLKRSIHILNSLSIGLRGHRMARGALELSSLEVKFQLDIETHSANDVDVYHIRDTNKLVEEFMLLANSSVAQFILKKLPQHSVLRRHPAPKAEHLKMLQTLLAQRGFHNFKFSTSLELSKSLENLRLPDDPYFNKVIRVLTTRCMNQAIYVCSGEVDQFMSVTKDSTSESPTMDSQTSGQFYHYGLAAPLYTHFTSPIRRYADILVHRLLAVGLGMIPLPNQLLKKSLVEEQCKQMNLKHRNAQWASRSSIDYFTYRYFKTNGEDQVDGVIIAIKKNGIQVQIPRYGIEGVVFLSTQKFRWIPESYSLTYTCEETNSEQSLCVFDHVWIRIKAEEKDFRPKTTLEFLYKTPKSVYSSVAPTVVSPESLPFLKE